METGSKITGHSLGWGCFPQKNAWLLSFPSNSNIVYPLKRALQRKQQPKTPTVEIIFIKLQKAETSTAHSSALIRPTGRSFTLEET